MKRLLALILAVALAISTVGCGGGTSSTASGGDASGTSASGQAQGLKVGIAFAGWNTNQNWLQLRELLHETRCV